MAHTCQVCGNELAIDARHCDVCGATVARSPQAEAMPLPPGSPPSELPAQLPSRPEAEKKPQPGAPTALRREQPLARRAQDAMLLEYLAFVGFLGIGHMYAGRRNLGLALMFGWFLLWSILLSLGVLSGGIMACLLMPVALPIAIGVPIYSGWQVKRFVLTHHAPNLPALPTPTEQGGFDAN